MPRRAKCGRGVRLRTAIRRLLGDRRGVAAIEFAIAAPVFILFSVGLIEFSRYLWTNNGLEYGAEQAARYVIANPTASTADLQAVAANQVPAVNPGAVTVTVTHDTTNGVNFVTVTTSTPFQSITGLVPLPTVTLTGSARVPAG